LLTSGDRGRTWARRPVPSALVSLVVSPEDPKLLVAADTRELHLSRNGGKTWRTLRGGSGLLSWPRPDRLYLADSKGVVSLSGDGGRRWQAVGQLPGAPAAFDNGGGRLYAALHHGTILQSDNGGSTWRVRSKP